ncbi:type IV pilus modification PilV family protein [Microbacterium sp. 22242]|uniref:type IV pilus modification PilV family protein n=1 Tax=Microbacterium sp. 22242 TaxID=3453896 RepID=UPI003F8520F6
MRDLPGVHDQGFGLVELIIAMFLLAIITVALIPALYNGIVYSSQQSTTATATRAINGLVEQVRQSPNCATIAAAVGAHSYSDGVGKPIATSGVSAVAPQSPFFTDSTGANVACGTGTLATLVLTAKDSSGVLLATVTAKVYLP